MFGRRQRQEERMYWEGLRDALALVTGVVVGPAGRPALFNDDEPPANWTKYRQGFEDGKRAAKRIHRDALVSEVRRLSLKPGDKLVIKSTDELTAETVERIQVDLGSRFPDNEILIFAPGTEPSVIRSEPVVVHVALDDKEIGRAVARAAERQAARA